MRFLPKNTTITLTQVFSGVPRLEHYIELTKNNVNDKMADLLADTRPNLSKKATQSLKSLKNAQQTLTIKPADKNLGLVVMNTDDYLQQCTELLTHKATRTIP